MLIGYIASNLESLKNGTPYHGWTQLQFWNNGKLKLSG